MWEDFGIQSHVEKRLHQKYHLSVSKVSDFSFPLLSSLNFVHRDLVMICFAEKLIVKELQKGEKDD